MKYLQVVCSWCKDTIYTNENIEFLFNHLPEHKYKNTFGFIAPKSVNGSESATIRLRPVSRLLNNSEYWLTPILGNTLPDSTGVIERKGSALWDNKELKIILTNNGLGLRLNF